MKKAAGRGALDADGMTLRDMFQTASTVYQAPLFQRRYVWGSKQVNQLWDDIQAVLDGVVDTRFLGALVLSNSTVPLPGQPTTYLMVDGQQRLTTLFMLLAAIAESASSVSGGQSLAEEAVDAIVNRVGSAKGRPKLETTLHDRSQFHHVVSRLKPAIDKLGLAVPLNPPPPYGPTHGAISRTAESIRSKVTGRIRDSSLAAAGLSAAAQDAAKLAVLTTLFDVAMNHLKFVGISLGDDDDPHQVFDRLNSAGIKLKVSDLVRNEVFERLSHDPDRAEALANGDWREFEGDLGDRFEDFVFSYGLIKKATITKGVLLQELRDQWSGQTAEQILADMRLYVPAFLSVAEVGTSINLRPPVDSLPKPILDQIERLRRMPIPASVYPYATMVVKAVSDGMLALGKAQTTLRVIESFLIRRAFAGLEPTGLHAVFKSAWTSTAGDPLKLIKDIEARATVSFPDDDQFAQDIKSRAVYSMRLLPYVLSTYESELKGDAVPATSQLTVDHVMPQTLGSAWPGIAKPDHDRVKDTWANLVPLTGPRNSAKGNLPWKNVKDRLKLESIWKTPRVVAANYPTWNFSAIEKRGKELAAWALNQWPRNP